MTADEGPNPFKLPDGGSPNGGAMERLASCIVYFIGAVLVTVFVLLFLNAALGRPGCSKPFLTVAPSTQAD